MTAHVHDHPIHDAQHRPDTPTFQDAGLTRPTRPRWLVPGLATAFVAAALVVVGVVSLSTVLYFGFFGGMILMHVGGHGGHGGHAGHGGQETQGRGGDATPDADDLSHGSLRSQHGQARSDEVPEGGASIQSNGNETQDHDQHSSHGCH
jgi:hypothetical protein